jgi:hypothetical protein
MASCTVLTSFSARFARLPGGAREWLSRPRTGPAGSEESAGGQWVPWDRGAVEGLRGLAAVLHGGLGR